MTLALLGLLAVAGSASASQVSVYDFATEKRHVLGEAVPIRLVNDGTTTITMGKTWDLTWLNGDGTAFYQWTDGELELAPGESRVWTWDQRVNACYGECQNVSPGDPAEAGRYEVTTTIDGIETSLRFSLGQYFTLGFRERQRIEFVVFVATQPEIIQMTDQAHTEDDTESITSGIVRGRRSYNPDWNFSMDPYSIVLGDMFIEVCDASPWYVQRYRSEWMGERWCPWGSYVKRVGR